MGSSPSTSAIKNNGGATDDVKNYELAKTDYSNGLSIKEIADKYNVSVATVRKWKSRYRWDSMTKERDKSVTKENKKNKIDWLKLENEYVTDITDNPITLKKLSEKYNISFNTIQDYSADNNWSSKRQKFHRNVTEKTQEKLSNQTADAMAQIINNINSALLKATKELHIHEEVNGFGKLVTIQTDTVRTDKLGRLVKAITSLQKVEVEKEKLDIEKQKINKGSSKDNLPIFITGEDDLED